MHAHTHAVGRLIEGARLFDLHCASPGALFGFVFPKYVHLFSRVVISRCRNCEPSVCGFCAVMHERFAAALQLLAVYSERSVSRARVSRGFSAPIVGFPSSACNTALHLLSHLKKRDGVEARL